MHFALLVAACLVPVGAAITAAPEAVRGDEAQALMRSDAKLATPRQQLQLQQQEELQRQVLLEQQERDRLEQEQVLKQQEDQLQQTSVEISDQASVSLAEGSAEEGQATRGDTAWRPPGWHPLQRHRFDPSETEPMLLPHLPAVVDAFPLFFTTVFVMTGIGALAGACMYVYMKEAEEEKRLNARLQHYGAAYTGEPPADEAVPGPGRQKRKKAWSSSDSVSSTTASGDESTSQHSDGSRRSAPVIREGTLLVAKVQEAVFKSCTSWEEVGVLSPGQQVVAAGPLQVQDDFAMVPIKPSGAVDANVLEVVSTWER